MELKQFEYTKNPYASSTVYNIHPLSRDGFSQYISNDSYTHRYIKNKFDSKILEKIYGVETSRPKTSHQNFHNSNSNLNSNYDDYLNQTNRNNDGNNFTVTETNNKHFQKLNSDFDKKENRNENSTELKNIENLKSNLMRSNTGKNNLYKSDKIKEMNFENGEYSDPNNNIDNDNNNNNNLDEFHMQSKRNCYSSYNRIPSKNKKTNLSKTNNASEAAGFYNNSSSKGNKNNLNKFLSMNKNLNKKHNPKDNIRWETNYASNIEYLKKNQNLFFDFDPHEENLTSFSRIKKHDGFESFNIPRLENLQADASKPAFHYTQRLVKSCVGKRKENSTNNNNNLLNYQNNLDKENNNSNKRGENHEQMNVEKIKEENEKLRNILNMQTNKDFLRTGNMPKISYVALQPKLVIKKFGLGGQGKFLGGKFNPDNFQTGKGNDRNRRNYIGGLFSN